MASPTLKLVTKTQKSTVVDHVATGQLARAFREFKRVDVSELSAKLGFATPSSVTRLERGDYKWSPELCVRYIRGVKELVAGNSNAIPK